MGDGVGVQLNVAMAIYHGAWDCDHRAWNGCRIHFTPVVIIHGRKEDTTVYLLQLRATIDITTSQERRGQAAYPPYLRARRREATKDIQCTSVENL